MEKMIKEYLEYREYMQAQGIDPMTFEHWVEAMKDQ